MYEDIIKSLIVCARAEREYECFGCAYRDKGYNCNSMLMADAAEALKKFTADP